MKISVLTDVHLLPEAQQKIQTLSDTPVVFPENGMQPTSLTEFVQMAGDAGAILVGPGTKVTREQLAACPNVKYIGVCGSATQNVDQAMVEDQGIVLTNVTHYGDASAAEFIFMQLVALARGVNGKQWREYPAELMGKSIGIIGLGSLGQSLARLALAYKMQVSYCGSTRKHEWEDQGVSYAGKRDLLKTSDIVIISSPSNVEVLGAEEFAIMQPGTLLVQASAGNCFDRAAFLGWVGSTGNFALFDASAGSENYEAYSHLPNVVFSKMTAGYSHETLQRLGDGVFGNLQAYLSLRV